MSDWVTEIWKVLGNGAAAAAIVGLLSFIFRESISSYFAERASFGYKQRLVEIEDKLTRERAEIADLRSILISGVLNRNEKLLDKQISASEELWRAKTTNQKHVMATRFLQSINIEEMDKSIKDGRVKEFVDATAKMSGVQKLIDDASLVSTVPSEKIDTANLCRPFVSPVAWALYSAHSSIIWHAVVTMIAWKNGVTTKFLKNDDLVEAAKKALPHQSGFLDKYGVGGTYFLIDELGPVDIRDSQQR